MIRTYKSNPARLTRIRKQAQFQVFRALGFVSWALLRHDNLILVTTPGAFASIPSLLASNALLAMF